MESGGTYGALHLNNKVTPRVHGLVVSGQPDINALCEGGGGEEEESEQELQHGKRLGQQGRREQQSVVDELRLPNALLSLYTMAMAIVARSRSATEC